VKKGHLRRCPRFSSLNVPTKYASLLEMSGALHLALFDQPRGRIPFRIWGDRLQESEEKLQMRETMKGSEGRSSL
jgi:hypothetical protein